MFVATAKWYCAKNFNFFIFQKNDRMLTCGLHDHDGKMHEGGGGAIVYGFGVITASHT